MQQAPLSPDIGSLDRLDSLHEYFILTSPPDSPPVPCSTAITQNPNQQPPSQEDVSKSSLDVYGYYHGYGGNLIAPQENVMQSTSIISVDRSNALDRNGSLGFGRMMPSTRDIDEMLKTDDKDMSVVNLTELFLKSSHRTSLNNIYQAAGALKGHDKDLRRNRSNSLTSSLLEDKERTLNSKDATADEFSDIGSQIGPTTNAKTAQGSVDSDKNNAGTSFDLDIDVEPTPLHEIKAKSELRRQQREQATRRRRPQEQPQEQLQDALIPQKLDQLRYQDRRNRKQHSSNYYPFGRAYQLPIPTMPSVSPPQSASTTRLPLPVPDAVATAAALASVQDEKNGNRRPNMTLNDPAQAYQIHGHTSPPSTPLQPSGHQTWPLLEGTAVSRNASRPDSTSPPTCAAHPQHQHYPHHQQSHLQQNHPSYSKAPHHLATSLAVGTMPPGKHAVPHKVVGPYTTAQQGNSNVGRRTTDAIANTTFGTRVVAPPAPQSNYLPRRGNHTTREASAAHIQPKGVHDEAAKARRGHIGFHKPATSQTTNTYHHPLPQRYPNYAPVTTAASHGVRLSAQYTIKKAAPPPPIAKKPSQTRAQTAQDKSSAHVVQHHQHQAAASAHASAAVPGDTAYERKKQRAKDARVKLNESIERLHVSMGVAGSESKKRTEQLRNFMKITGRENENHTDHQAFELMDSCIKTAESAKKWDRPNFVGSAATMISCLNSQCEILMKELMEYQQAKSPFELPGNPEQPNQKEKTDEMRGAAMAAGLHSASSNPSHYESLDHLGRQHRDLNILKRPPLDQAEDTAEKRRRCMTGKPEEEKIEAPNGSSTKAEAVSLDTTSASMTICAPMDHPPVHFDDSVVGLIASYLDPTSLVRSARVCKGWSTKGRGFQKDETWTMLCLKRFGHLKTRKWQEQQSDKDDDKVDGSEGSRRVEGMVLYRTMSSANVMPSFQTKGRIQYLIGQGFLQNDGGASAWLFLVERSNGETARSVKRHPSLESSTRNSGVYVSLPVVELRILIQNIGVQPTPSGKDTTIVINKQVLSVDASTRRRGEELFEVDWDDKFAKKLLNLDGTPFVGRMEARSKDGLVRLGIFDSVVLVVYIHARRCSTTCKFLQRSNFLRLLLSSRGTTQALVIPIGEKKTG